MPTEFAKPQAALGKTEANADTLQGKAPLSKCLPQNGLPVHWCGSKCVVPVCVQIQKEKSVRFRWEGHYGEQVQYKNVRVPWSVPYLTSS